MLTRLTFIAVLCISLLLPASAGASDAPRRPREATEHHHRPVVTWQGWQAVLRVHNCEEPRWDIRGSVYSGGLGWLNSLWPKWKEPWMPQSMADATALEQSWAMAHFIKDANAGWWPDQNGCSGSY